MKAALGAMQGMLIAEHQIPPNAVVMELKHCENCTRQFLRPRSETQPFIIHQAHNGFYPNDPTEKELRRDHGQRYCADCIARQLQPADDIKYREMLPNEIVVKHSFHMPKYDRPNAGKGLTIQQRIQRKQQWMIKLLEEFSKSGAMTAHDMREITGLGSAVLQCVRMAGIEATPVGFRNLPRGGAGRASALYALRLKGSVQ